MTTIPSLTAFLLFGSLFWTLTIITVFIIACLIADLGKNGFYAFFAFILLGTTYYFWGHFKDVASLFTVGNIVCYLTIGFLYSILRTFVEGRKLGKRIAHLPTLEELKVAIIQSDKFRSPQRVEHKESYIEDYKTELKNNVARWWFLWWISAITWVLGDLLKDVWDTIYHWLNNFYNNILDYGIRTVLGKTKTQ
jgi:hypothetical protein